MRICSLAGCGKKHRAKGFCSQHYNAQLLRTSPKYQQAVAAYKQQWAEANRDRVRENHARWREANPEALQEMRKRERARPESKAIRLADYAARRALKLKATPKWASKAAIREIYMGRPEGWHVDHLYPLKSDWVCGLHVEQNLQYLPAAENLRKSNKPF